MAVPQKNADAECRLPTFLLKGKATENSESSEVSENSDSKKNI